MAIWDLFSRRQAVARGEVPDVYRYDELPTTLRVQLIHIWRRVYDLHPHQEVDMPGDARMEPFVTQLREELGQFELVKNYAPYRIYSREISDYFMGEADIERSLNVVELLFGGFAYLLAEESHFQRPTCHGPWDILDRLDAAVVEVNERFRRAGVGYQLEQGIIVRVDNQLLHQEVIRPALHLLHAPGFEGPEQEFRSAHEHHRHDRNEEALTDALKAFESTMKVICGRHRWAYDADRDTANRLVQHLRDGGLFPGFMESQLNHTVGLLTSALPPVRNKMGGHGQGEEIREVPAYMVAFALHACAANIVFLVEASNARRP